MERLAAGAAEKPSENQITPHKIAKILEYAWTLKKQAFAESAIEGRMKLLKRLIRLGADLSNPESVKDVIAKQKWSEGRKELAVEAYGSFLKFLGGKWIPPKYQRIKKNTFHTNRE